MVTQSLLRIVSFSTLALASALHAAPAPDNLMAAIKFPPPKTLSDKVMTLARAIQPGQQTEMLPLIFLGAFGYPNYPGISETDAVTLFVFDSDDGASSPMVLIAKVAKDNPLRQMLGNFNIVTQDRGDWLLLAQDPDAFNEIKDWDALLAINQEKAQFDIEARFFLGQEKVTHWVNGIKAMLTQRHHAASGGNVAPLDLAKKLRFVDFAAAAVENMVWAEIGLNLRPDAIELGKVLKAQPGTPEATLFSSKAGGAVPAASLVASGGMIDYYGKVNNAALQAYYSVLQERAQGMVGPDGKAWLETLDGVVRQYFTMSDGTMAGTVSAKGLENLMVSVSGGTFTDEALVSILKTSYDDLTPQFLKSVRFSQLPSADMMDFSYTLNDTTVGSTPVHKVSVTVNMDEADDMPALAPGTQTQTYYYAVVSGNLLQTSTLDDIKTLIATIGAGKPVAQNLASTLAPVSGAAIQYRYDIIGQIAATMDAASQFAPISGPYADAVSTLKSENLAPATGAVIHSDNQIKATVSIPLNTVVRSVQVMQEAQAAEAMRMMQDDDMM